MRRLRFNKGVKFKKQQSLLLLVLLLAACEARVESMSFYEANGNERRSVLADCADYPSKRMTDGNCINAAAALKSLKLELRKEKNVKIEEEQTAAEAAAGPIPRLTEACGGIDGVDFKICRDDLRAMNRRLLAELNAINERIAAEFEAKLEAL